MKSQVFGRALAGIALATFSVVAFGGQPTVEYASGEILIGFKAGTSSAAKTAVYKKINGKVTLDLTQINAVRVKLGAGFSNTSAISSVKTMTGVLYAEQNPKEILADTTPNDPQYNSQYSLKKLQGPKAWDLSKGDGVVVAVIDTGSTLNHEDLKNKLVTGYDFSDNDPDPTDVEGHGTHCCGIVGAESGNNKGVASIGYNVKVMPLKIFPNATGAVSAAALIHAADHGAKVCSMSYGSYGQTTTELNAINYAWNKGVVLVAAAGNFNVDTKFYPAAYPNVISVGATDSHDVKASFSQFGDWVRVAGPGVDVQSTLPGGYGALSGTSMACPNVAGVVGLLWSFAPASTTNTQIRSAIESTTDPVGNWLHFGRVNALRALQVFGSTAIDTHFGPDSIATLLGSQGSGDVTSVQTFDTASFEVGTEISTLGQVAAVELTIPISAAPNDIKRASLSVVATGDPAAANQVWLWNFNTGQYELFGSTALSSSPIERLLKLTPGQLNKYIGGGEMKVMMRAILPNRYGHAAIGFDYKVNTVSVVARL